MHLTEIMLKVKRSLITKGNVLKMHINILTYRTKHVQC